MIKSVWKCMNIIAISPKSGMEQAEIIDTFWTYQLLNGHPRRFTTPWPSLATVPVYNAVAIFRDHTVLQRRGRLSRLRRLTTRKETSPSVPDDPSVLQAN